MHIHFNLPLRQIKAFKNGLRHCNQRKNLLCNNVSQDYLYLKKITFIKYGGQTLTTSQNKVFTTQ